MTKTTPVHVSTTEFEKLFQAVNNWGRWGLDDDRGTLNYICPEHVRRAAGLVRSGRSVSMAIPINKTAGPDNPRPATHHMVQNYDYHSELGQPLFCADYLASECHRDCHTYIDALCHIGYQGKLYNGKPVSAVTSHGATIMDITAYAHGVVGRGVLLDIPRLRGVKWLEPGEAVTRDELEAAEEAQGVRLGEGDIFVFRTGHHRRRLELGPAPVRVFGLASVRARGHTVDTILCAMAAMALTAISYGRMASIYPAAGSAYSYLGRGLNQHLAFLASWAMLLDYLVSPLIDVVVNAQLTPNSCTS